MSGASGAAASDGSTFGNIVSDFVAPLAQAASVNAGCSAAFAGAGLEVLAGEP